MDATEHLILDESPDTAHRLLVIDCPGLHAEAVAVSGRPMVWCDDLRDLAGLPDGVRALPNLDADTLAGIDLVWLRLPTSLAGLDEYAELIANRCSPEVRVIAGGRIKDMTRSMNEVLATHFGHVSASLGRQKARVLRAGLPYPASTTWPRTQRHEVDLGASKRLKSVPVTITAHGMTFAGTKIDHGTSLLLSHLDEVPIGGQVLDLGCGNGTITACLGLVGHKNVQAGDVSWSAVASTRTTAAANGVDAVVTWADGLGFLPDRSLDVIVTNPPFHRGVARESSPTLDMFAEAARVLRPGGELWCVYNSHLPWRARLNELVGQTRVVEQTPFYTLTRSERR